MLTINNTTGDHRPDNAANVERIHGRVELSYCDAAKIGSFAVPEAALPGLSAGDRLFVSSGGAGAYRTVLRVEPIAGGAVMIMLDPGRVQAATAVAIE